MKRILIARLIVVGCVLACLWAPVRACSQTATQTTAEKTAAKAAKKAASAARRQQLALEREQLALAIQQNQYQMAQNAQTRQRNANGTPADESALLKQLTSTLKLTADQRTKVKAILDAAEQKLTSLNADKALSQQQKDEVRSQEQAQMWTSIEALLDPDQLAKLDGARRTAFVAGLPVALSLTNDQERQVTAVFNKEAAPDLLIRQDASLSMARQQERLSDVRDSTWTAAEPILTSDQQVKLDSLRQTGKLARLSTALGLSAQQQTQVGALLKKRDTDARRKSPDQTPASLQDQREAADDTLWTNVAALLSPDQQSLLATRLKAQMVDHLSNQLQLTSTQDAAVEPVVSASYDEIGKVRADKATSPVAREEQQKTLRAAMWKRIRPLLTAAQRVKLTAMNAPAPALVAIAH